MFRFIKRNDYTLLKRLHHVASPPAARARSSGSTALPALAQVCGTVRAFSTLLAP